MFETLKDGDLVITANKDEILNYLNENKKIIALKIMTLNEFTRNFFEDYDEKALYYLMKKYNYSHDVASLYLKNIHFLPDLKKELEGANLLYQNKLFKKSFKRVVTVDTVLDPYIIEALKEYEVKEIKRIENNYTPNVFEFDKLEDEIAFICEQISRLSDEVSLDNIFLVLDNRENETLIRRIFNFYHIPLEPSSSSLFEENAIQGFLKDLKETKDLDGALNKIADDSLKNTLINILNRYQFTTFDDTIFKCLIFELKNTKKNLKNYRNVVKIIKTNEMFLKDAYYFIPSFQLDNYPLAYKDEDYFDDKDKEKLGILTSLKQTLIAKEKIKNILKSFLHLTISYHLEEKNDKAYPSLIIEEENLEIIKDYQPSFSYSNLYNKLLLTRKLDLLYKFGKQGSFLSKLYGKYPDIPYLEYKNDYQQIAQEKLLKYLGQKLTLSYTSINNYYHCAFRYYLENILKLNQFEETFMTRIGTIFHNILAKIFNDNSDFDELFNEEKAKYEFNAKEEFFITKLKEELNLAIQTIKEQDKFSKLNEMAFEKRINIKFMKKIPVTFTGIVDKIKFKKIDKNFVVQIIDYKTGELTIDLNNLYYGLDMQLPIYLYLVKNGYFKDATIAGFYLQKIIHKKLNYEKGKDYLQERKKLFRLDGFSNSDENILSLIDDNYKDSSVIKGMKVGNNGFYQNSKVLTNDEIAKIEEMTNAKINEGIDKILNADFNINPKKIDNILVGCAYCKFKEICFRKEEDIIYLKKQNYKEFLRK